MTTQAAKKNLHDHGTPGPSPNLRKRLARAITQTAPQLAEALGGPLAGAAVEAITRAVTGEGPEQVTGPEVLEKIIIGQDPQLALRLRKADIAFAEAVWAAQNNAARIAAEDRANARARQVALRDWTPSVLGGAVIVGFFLVLSAMLSGSVPEGATTEFSIMLGALATMTAAVVNFFFGSSSGSKDKDQMIRELRG